MGLGGNGTELTQRAILHWQEDRGAESDNLAPGYPMQNAFVESLSGRLRDDRLNERVFAPAARLPADRGMEILYNTHRPHTSLSGLTAIALQSGAEAASPSHQSCCGRGPNSDHLSSKCLTEFANRFAAGREIPKISRG